MNTMRADVRRSTIITGAILLSGILLRVWGIGQSCFWYDEAQTLMVARLPLGDIARTAYRPPLYHYLLHIWDLLVPSTEGWLRVPSLLFGIAALLLVYLTAKILYGRGTAWLAGILAATSPVLIYYSQELRMYSLITAAFMLMLLLTTRVVVLRERQTYWHWAVLWLAEVVALYSHYFSAPFLLAIAVLAIAVSTWQRRWSTLRAFLAVQSAALVAFAPWGLVIRSGRSGLSDYTASELLPVNTSVPQVRDFIGQLIGFYTQGPLIWDTALDRVLGLVAVAGIAALLIYVVVRVVQVRRKPETSVDALLLRDAFLLAVCLLPTTIAAVLFHFRPGVVSPRQLMMLSGPLMILLARAAVALWQLAQRYRGVIVWLPRVAAIILVASVLLVQGYAQYRNMRYPERLRPDVRALVDLTAQYAGPNDLVLMSYYDHAFDYYFGDRARVFHLDTRVPDADLMDWALPRLQGAQRAVLLRWVHVYADPRDHLSWFLGSNGYMVHQAWSSDRLLSAYELQNPLEMPEFVPQQVSADTVRLASAALPKQMPVDQRLPVALEWRAVRPPGVQLRAAVRLVSPDGEVVARDDRLLMAEQGDATSERWLENAGGRNYYLLEIAPGTAPLTYSVEVSLYTAEGEIPFTDSTGKTIGTSYQVGMVSLGRAADLAEGYLPDTAMTAVERELVPGIVLDGYQLDRDTIQPGEGLFVTLFWRAIADRPQAREITLEIVHGDTPVGSQSGAPVHGRYPTSQWQRGELVRDRRLLRAEVNAPKGNALIRLQLEGGESLDLGSITIAPSTRSFTLPEMRYPSDARFDAVGALRGFDLASTALQAGEPLTLTLYWQALNQQALTRNYVVFTHLLDASGRLIAQHDGQPDEGRQPTSSWLLDQVVSDTHTLVWLEETADYRGLATLEVGLYDPANSQRLALPDGSDRLILPLELTVK